MSGQRLAMRMRRICVHLCLLPRVCRGPSHDVLISLLHYHFPRTHVKMMPWPGQSSAQSAAAGDMWISQSFQFVATFQLF